MKKNLHLGLKLIVISFISVCFSLPIQKDNSAKTASQLNQQDLIRHEGNWYYFKASYNTPADGLFKNNYSFFDLPQGIDGKIEKTDVDENGMIHYLIKLKKNGIPIEDAYFTAHYSKGGALMYVVGKYKKEDIPLEMIAPRITSTEAFQNAKKAFISSENIQVKEEIELINSEITKPNNENYTTPPYLVYYRSSKKNDLKLCYRVDISSEILEKLKTVYIDAITGEIAGIVDYKAQNVVNVVTVYNGSKQVQVEWRGWPYSYYYLRDETLASPVEARNSTNHSGTCDPWGFGNLDQVYKGDLNEWPLDFKDNAQSSYWAVEESYNVFKNVFGRTYGTHSSSGGEIRMENNYNTTGPFYEPSGSDDYIHVGKTIGSYSGFEGGLDVIGHEFTHGVMYRARGVGGNAYGYNETGALMESFSDIFGEVIEYYTLGSNDWIEGTNLHNSFKRSLEDPKDFDNYTPYPTIYLDGNCKYYIPDSLEYEYPTYYGEPSCWIGGSGGFEAHIDNAVQNYWFYLLSQGDSQLGVTGIGIVKAANIAYHNMAYFFSLGSTFDDMRQASIANAESLYGRCSDEYSQVQNAWAAVGVGAPASLCININGPSTLYNSQYGIWEADIHNGSSPYNYRWYVDGDYHTNSASLWMVFTDEEWTNHVISVAVTDASSYDSLAVNVNVNPEIFLNAYKVGDEYLSSGQTGNWEAITHGGDGENYTYTWYIDNNFYSNDESISYEFYDEEETEHTIDLTVHSGTQTEDAPTSHIYVTPERKSMSQLISKIKMTVYPNPATSSATIEIIDSEISTGSRQIYDISIIDYYGKLLSRRRISDRIFTIDCSPYIDGIYSILVTSGNKKISAQFVIKR